MKEPIEVRQTFPSPERSKLVRIGIAADHGGFELKQKLAARLRDAGHEVVDFGAHQLTPDDDYPDFVIPLGQAVAPEKWSVAWPFAAAASGPPFAPTKSKACAPA